MMKLYRQLSIRSKLLVFLCVVSILPLLLSSRVLTNIGGNSFKKLLDYQIEDGLDQVEHAFSTTEQRLQEAVVSVARWEELAHFFEHPNGDWFEANLETWAPQSYSLDYIGLFDAQGHPIHSWSVGDPVDPTYLAPLLLSGDTITSGWISTPQGMLLAAQSPVSLQGTLLGKVIFSRQMSHRFLTEQKLDQQADILVYYGGRLLATTDTSTTLPFIDPATLFAELVQKDSTYQYYSRDDNRVVGFRSLVNIAGAEVAALGYSASQSSARFVQQSIHNMLFYFGIPLLALVILAALVLGLWIEGPIRMLSQTMEDIRLTGDLTKRAPITGGGEMASMSQTFNDMLQQLSTQHDELIRFRKMILTMKEGVLIEDADNRIVYMNPRMEDMLGVTLEEIAAQTEPPILNSMINIKSKRIMEEPGFNTEEVEWIRIDGRRFQAIKTSGKLEDQQGKGAGLLSTFVDITERNDLELELIETSRMAFLGLFSQGVLHNISGPINSILGFSNLLARKAGEDEIPQRIHTDAERIADQITILGRRWHRTGTHQLEMLNLNEIIQDELKFLEADLFYKHNVEKIFDLDPLLPTIRGSYGDFSHALLNIIINSIDALLDSPIRKLIIRSRFKNGEIRMEIEDTGEGIQPEHISKIFLPFFSTKRRDRKEGLPSGAGLGLAIARKVLEPYRVRFEVQSQPGQGTLMILRIPVDHQKTGLLELEEMAEAPK